MFRFVVVECLTSHVCCRELNNRRLLDLSVLFFFLFLYFPPLIFSFYVFFGFSPHSGGWVPGLSKKPKLCTDSG